MRFLVGVCVVGLDEMIMGEWVRVGLGIGGI